MTDADKAYQLAEERIEWARQTDARVLALSPDRRKDGRSGAEFAELSSLERIPPSISSLNHLEKLNLASTQVMDISPLANMISIRTLDLRATRVADISPLAGMIKLEWLWLSYTSADLLQLVAEGAAWAEEDRALRYLEFSSTPAARAGECLYELNEAADNDKDRTKAALAALRAERDRQEVEGSEAVEPPEQRPEGPAYTLGTDNRIQLIDPSLGLDDAEQEVLHAELMDHLAALITALAGSNEFATLRSRAERYQNLLSQAPEDIGARAAWALANTLRRALEAEEAAAASGRSSDQMPPIAASELAGAVETGGLWLMGHPGVAEVERAARDYRYGPETPAELEAAENLITDMADALDDDTRTVLGDLLATGKERMPAGVQATKVLLDAGWNLVSYITRTVWLAGGRSLKGVAFVGSVGGGAAILGKLILTHEATLRAYLLVEAPYAVRSLDALVAGIKVAARFFGV